MAYRSPSRRKNASKAKTSGYWISGEGAKCAARTPGTVNARLPEQGDRENAVPLACPADPVDQQERPQERGQHGGVREEIPVLIGGAERVHDDGIDERGQEHGQENPLDRLGPAQPTGEAPADQDEPDGVHEQPLVQHVEEVHPREELPRWDEDEPAVAPAEVERVHQSGE
jgi:hypothetical protein